MTVSDDLAQLTDELAATRARLELTARRASDKVRASLSPPRTVTAFPLVAAGAAVAAVAAWGWWRSGGRQGRSLGGVPAGPVAERVSSSLPARVTQAWRYASLALAVASAIGSAAAASETRT
jgi:hypothetical protein